jgi:hypothetical protein
MKGGAISAVLGVFANRTAPVVNMYEKVSWTPYKTTEPASILRANADIVALADRRTILFRAIFSANFDRHLTFQRTGDLNTISLM